MMSVRRFLLLSSFLGLCYSNICSYTNLVEELQLSNHSKDVRPVLNWEDTTNVTVSMFLYTIVKLDNSLQILTSYVWFSMEWKNEFINWDPQKFCNITHFFYKPDSLWTPDSYIQEMTEADDKNPVIPFYEISYNGFVTASKPIRIVSSCNLNIYHYPFDTQTCSITIGRYINEDVDFNYKYNSSYLYEQTKTNFFNIGEWRLKDFNVSKVENGARYQITIRRNAALQVIAFIVPICFLIFLDVIGMFIHLRDTERLMFKITVVLGFALLLVVLNQVLSTSEKPPLLSLFCCVCMAIMVASIIVSITTTYMMNLSETDLQVPRWLKFLVIKCLARVLFFKVQPNKSNVPETENDNGAAQMSGINSSKDGKNALETQLLKTLLKEVEIIHQKLQDSKSEDHIISDWHTVALVVDRLFVILYLVTIFILFVVMFSVWNRN